MRRPARTHPTGCAGVHDAQRSLSGPGHQQADVSVCFLLADGGEPVPRWTVSNTQPGAKRLSATSSAMLTELTIDELAQQSLAELARYLQTQDRGHFSDPAALAATLQQAARDAYRLDKVLAEPLRIVLSTAMANIHSLTARKLVRLVDAPLRTQTLYQPPEQRQTPAGSEPHARRPQRQRRQRQADPVT